VLTKVISGGQTGADQAGLRAAKTAGIATGGSHRESVHPGVGEYVEEYLAEVFRLVSA